MKKVRTSVPLFFLAAFLASVTPALSQTQSNENSDPYQGAAQRDSHDESNSYGWIGLLGLAGLLGLRRNRHRDNATIKTVVIVTSLLASGATLSSVTPALSQNQPAGQGSSGDNSARRSQEDIEDHETNFDWVGYFGLAGLVGWVGPKRTNERTDKPV
ncbi:WGxxGxxG family protein [Spirosoma luteum]|uniref:WGxxGxxG family protein n=1 Tax=Spirosoma luteum TaxID=431553 RepID=UPI00037A872F|nr:WGxxGxxG family protein [Spirosoma luteum]